MVFVAEAQHVGGSALAQLTFDALFDEVHLGRIRRNQPDSAPSINQRGSQFFRE